MATSLIFAYNNCGLINTPRVDDMSMAAVGYAHSGYETDCMSCHERNRPKPKNGYIHGSGANCLTCHNQVGWTVGVVKHSPPPASCLECHLSDRPVGPTGALKFDHARSGQSDCVSCHAGGSGVTFTGANFTHSPAPLECNSCHSNLRPVGLIGTPPFNHAQGGQGDCVSCHKTPGVAWTGGAFNHTPAPVTCAGCHSAREPVALIQKMFHNSSVVTQDCATCHKTPGTVWSASRYHQNVNPQPGSCVDCHNPQRPVGLIGTPPFNHAQGGQGDCVSCHKNPGGVWSGASFNHQPAPTSCVGCHSARRPVGLVGTPPFNHALGGSGDCVSCHKNAGVTWAGGSFTHVPKPAACKDCHLGRLPTTIVNRMSHTGNFVAQDCTICHTNVGVSWAGGKFHAGKPAGLNTCVTCHAGNRPVGNVGVPAFNHANGGSGDCFGCHKNPGVTWAGGLFAHSPVPVSCNQCHGGNRPTVTKYPTGNAIIAGHYNAKDCFACHQPESATLKQFLFKHNTATNQNIGFCLPCHLQDGIRQHGANGGGDAVYTGDGNCYSCHNSRKSWNN